jgi:cobalt-zinc-cadmium efflux system membrane fusion protein
MRSAIAQKALLALLTMFVLVTGLPAHAHEGHDHGAPPPPVSSTIAPRADASSTDFEIVLIARGDKLAIFLDTFRENQPVDGAAIEIDANGGILTPSADGPGTYMVAAPFLAKPGSYDLAITVSANGIVDILTATLQIPAATRNVAGQRLSLGVDPAIAQEVGPGTVSGRTPLLIAVALGFVGGVLLTSLVWRRRRAVAGLIMLVACPVVFPSDGFAAEPATFAARDVSQRFPDGALFVPKPTQRILGLRTIFTEAKPHRRSIELPGRVIPDPNASGLVQASVGGRLVPPVGGFKPLGTPVKTGDILAYVRPPIASADLTTQQQQARELDQQISVVTRKVERFRAIQQVIAKSQLEDAELELKGLQARRANLERANKEPEPLLAPVDGVIAASNAVAGQMAEPNSVIFQIVDPTRLWVEALSFEPQETSGAAQGLFSGGRTVDLVYVGTGLADRNQSVPIHFAITSDAVGLRAGQFMTVLAATADERTGIAVPREAVLRGTNGQSIIYEHSNAERFVPREVRIEQLDAARVLIIAGIEPGKRIVTQGAELLNQIR